MTINNFTLKQLKLAMATFIEPVCVCVFSL